MSSTFTLDQLAAIIAERAEAGDASSSHTARLLSGGAARCARKFGEEAVEAIVAALEDDPPALAREAADVLYHLLVLLRASAVPLSDVMLELEARTARSGLAEKATRQP